MKGFVSMSNAFEPQFTDEPVQIQRSGTGKGCLIGCLIAGGLFAAACICAGVGAWMFFTNVRDQYTSTEPMDLKTVEYSDEEMKTLKNRIEGFRQKLNAGETPEQDLELTADDINAWISADEKLKGKVFVRIEDDQVRGDVSMPLDGLPMGSGRYFNGSGTFDVSMENGELNVRMQKAEVNGEPVPEPFMEGMRGENLAKEFSKQPENAEFLKKFEDISVKDGKFILRAKRDTGENDESVSPNEIEASVEAEDDTEGSDETPATDADTSSDTTEPEPATAS
ncbi:hypothetical protein C2E31_03055 [Rhodopirellula baltica]|nr:hypothetical protein C2E31_03055 [Rhodopirellula baltica]